MAWLAHVDARAAHWPPAARWLYVAFKWYLIIFGAFAISRVLLDRLGIWSLY